VVFRADGRGVVMDNTQTGPTDDMVAVDQHTRRWIERFVVGLNLCPFAAPLLRGEQVRGEQARGKQVSGGQGDRGNALRIAVCAQTRPRAMAEAVLAELELLRATPPDELVTSVLVFSEALRGFDDYLDFLALAEELLYESGLEGSVQIASFHPEYQFDGAEPDDVANFTNRAPYPMLHFLREDAVSEALERYPMPEQIPLRNIERLQAMGIDAVLTLLRDIERDR
jgi:hypothetical protein